MSVVAVTGLSGYIGNRMVRWLADDERVTRLVGIDIHPPRDVTAKLRFYQHDVAEPFADLFLRNEVTHAIHLAFVVNPLHDTERMRRIDLDGSENFLAACNAAGVKTMLVASSATAYGALPDNPVPLTEDAPVRGNSDYQYSREKAILDRRCQTYAADHPDVALKILRPAIVIGPNVDNYISRLMRRRIACTVAGADPLQQYVHEDDVARAFLALLFAGRRGAYNVAGDGALRLSEVAGLLGARIVGLPYRVLHPVTALLWHLRIKGLGEAPPGVLNYIRYPMVLANEKIKREVGFTFEYTTEEALRALAATDLGRRRRNAAGSRFARRVDVRP
jgi:UDP-glucose 4-epimerase